MFRDISASDKLPLIRHPDDVRYELDRRNQAHASNRTIYDTAVILPTPPMAQPLTYNAFRYPSHWHPSVTDVIEQLEQARPVIPFASRYDPPFATEETPCQNDMDIVDSAYHQFSKANAFHYLYRVVDHPAFHGYTLQHDRHVAPLYLNPQCERYTHT